MVLASEACLKRGWFTSLWSRIKKALGCFPQGQRDAEIDSQRGNVLRVKNIMTGCGGRTLNFRSGEAMRSREFTQNEQAVSEQFKQREPKE